MLIENVEEELDPVLDPVLDRRIIRKGKSMTIALADKEVSLSFARLPSLGALLAYQAGEEILHYSKIITRGKFEGVVSIS
jgi:hypothetical protein